jgi:hypothetical protein
VNAVNCAYMGTVMPIQPQHEARPDRFLSPTQHQSMSATATYTPAQHIKVKPTAGYPPPALPGACCVLASLQACTELPTGVQQVEVVAAHEVLRQANDGGLQAGFTVVIRRVL